MREDTRSSRPPHEASACFHSGSSGHMRGNRALHGNVSCLCGWWLFPGLPPSWRVCHTSQSQGLITWLISGQSPAPAPAQGPCQLGEGCCQAVPGTAVWCCLSQLLSPQPLLLCQECKSSKLGFHSWSCVKARDTVSAV